MNNEEYINKFLELIDNGIDEEEAYNIIGIEQGSIVMDSEINLLE
jgi:hypothetical protein